MGSSCNGTKLDGSSNADVTMAVHITADHSSISAVSIPRDTMMDLPASSANGSTRAADRGQFNQTMNYGVDCTLRAVYHLTGLPITHYAMVNFSGVIQLSNGVAACRCAWTTMSTTPTLT